MLDRKFVRKYASGGLALSLALTALSYADTTASGFGTCNGSQQCDGSNNGPDGVPWNQKSCQGSDPAQWRGYVGVVHCKWSTDDSIRCYEYTLLCYHGHTYGPASTDCNGTYSDTSGYSTGCSHPSLP